MELLVDLSGWVAIALWGAAFFFGKKGRRPPLGIQLWVFEAAGWVLWSFYLGGTQGVKLLVLLLWGLATLMLAISNSRSLIKKLRHKGGWSSVSEYKLTAIILIGLSAYLLGAWLA